MDLNEILKYREGLMSHFKDLKFDEPSHTYTVNGVKYPSVSSLIKNFYEEFDSSGVAPIYANRRGFNEQQVIDAWLGEGKIASDKGHRVHLFGEDYVKWRYFGIGEEPKVSCKQTLGIVDFWNNFPTYLVPVATELQMYSEEYGYSGTADIIAIDTRVNELLILDYKSNRDILEVGKPPLYHIPQEYSLTQNNLGKYALQFSFYQNLLQLKGYSVKGRVLIWLNEDKDNKKLYRTFKTPDLVEPLKSCASIWSPKLNGTLNK